MRLSYQSLPNAFTCCRQGSKICISCRQTNPIVATIISFNRNITNNSVPLAVFMKSIRHFIKLPFTCLWIPFTKCQCNTIVFQRPTSSAWVCDGFELMPRLNMGSTAKFFMKAIISFVNTSKFLLDRLTWQGVPMRVFRLF